MKLPHVSVEYIEEESFAPGEMSAPLIVGFGVHWAWVYAFMFNEASLFHVLPADAHIVMFSVSLLTLVATLLCYGLFLERARTLFTTPKDRQRNRAVGAVCMIVGVAIAIAGGHSASLVTIAAVLCGALVGFGSAILYMSFSVSFSTCDTPTIAISTGLSFIVSVLVFGGLVALGNVSAVAGLVICLLLPLAELYCLKECSEKLVDNLAFVTVTLPVKKASFALRIAIPSLILGFAIGLFREGAVFLPFTSSNQDAALPAIVLAGIFVALAIILATLAQRETKNYIFRTLCPLIAIMLLAATLGTETMGEFWRVFVFFSGYLMLEACLWIAYADITQRYRISPFVVFGFGRAAMALGSYLSFLLSYPTNPLGQMMDNHAVFAAVVLAAIIMGVYAMPTGPEIRRTLIRGKYCPAFDNAFKDNRTMPAVVQAVQTEAAEVLSEAPATVEQTAAEEAPKELVVPEITAAQAENQPPASPEESAGQAGNPYGNMGKFKRKCLAVADIYLLSQRESEILFLLAKGWNATAIQEHLYISSGTVNTHMRHIYRKINVHSQQELIATIESIDLDEA